MRSSKVNNVQYAFSNSSNNSALVFDFAMLTPIKYKQKPPDKNTGGWRLLTISKNCDFYSIYSKSLQPRIWLEFLSSLRTLAIGLEVSSDRTPVAKIIIVSVI